MSHNVWEWINYLSDEEIATMPPWAKLSSEDSEYKNCVPGPFADPDMVFEVAHKADAGEYESHEIQGPPEIFGAVGGYGIGWLSIDLDYQGKRVKVYDSKIDRYWYKKTYNKKRTDARKKLGYIKKDTKAFLKITQHQLELKVKAAFLLQDSIGELKRLNRQITSEEGFTHADYRAYIDLGRKMEKGAGLLKKLYKSVERTNF